MYHPAAALRTPAVEEASYLDVGHVPAALDQARERRAVGALPGPARAAAGAETPEATAPADLAPTANPEPDLPASDQLTLFR